MENERGLRDEGVGAHGLRRFTSTEVMVQKLEQRVLPLPPKGFCKVVGIWVDPSSGKLIVQWDDEPIT